ncbi:MAG: DUF6569 family protein, partial [Saprospiraceae bacterium]
MKNTRFLFFLLATAIFYSSCRPDTASTTGLTNNGLRLLTTATPAWTYRNMRVYPIVAETAALNGQEGLQHLTTLSEAMTTPGFRITEKKQFGRDEGPWYSALTVQNKTQDTVYLMSGEVVTGGNQDRVLAYDDVILPASLKNVEVFCVEKGRSHYYDASAPIAVQNEAAFKGYFS